MSLFVLKYADVSDVKHDFQDDLRAFSGDSKTYRGDTTNLCILLSISDIEHAC